MPTPADKSNSKESEGVAVIDRACAILFAFRPDDAALTLAELAALPEIGLAERFGEAGVHLRRLALGQTQRVLRITTPENKFEKRVELDHSLELLEPLLFVLSSILNELLSAMRRLSLGANRIHLGLDLLGLEGGAKSRHERILEFAAPIQDAAMLLKILQLDLEAHPAAAPITAVRIELNPVPPQSVQHGLFLPSQPEPQKLQLVLTRIAGLVGEHNVGSPALLEELQPAYPQIRIVRQPVNRGKTSALTLGLSHARGDIIVVQDADGGVPVLVRSAQGCDRRWHVE